MSAIVKEHPIAADPGCFNALTHQGEPALWWSEEAVIHLIARVR
jgi:hypothetical protein